MKFKPVQQAKEAYYSLKQTQKTIMFNAVWNGELIPGLPPKATRQIQKALKKIKGTPPGIKYKTIFETLEIFINDYKLGKINSNWVELKKMLLDAYPAKSRLTRKCSLKEIELNKSMLLELEVIFALAEQGLTKPSKIYFLDNILFKDLKESEERDKRKVLATI